MEQKKKPSIKMWIMIILATIVLLFILSISINFLRVRKGNPPIFYFSKSINSLDGSIVYNIFPYKITDYKNSMNEESYTEISFVFQPYNNKFYNPKSSKYVFSKEEYVAPVFNVNKYRLTIDDVIKQVNSNGFKLGTDSKYSNIYIGTSLNGENLESFKSSIENLIKEKYNDKKLNFQSLDELKEKEIYKNGKIVDGIYIRIAMLESKEKEDIMTLELITNVSEVFSQKVSISNIDLRIVYTDDFDQLERKAKEKAIKDEALRKELEEKREQARIEAERLEKEKAERELKEQLDLYKQKEERLNLLLSKDNLFILNQKKGFVESEIVDTIINKDFDKNNMKSYDFVRINSDKILYHYQEQVLEGKSYMVYIKEKELTNIEYTNIMRAVEGLTGYSGVGKYQESHVLEVAYLGKSRNLLLLDLKQLFEKHDFKI